MKTIKKTTHGKISGSAGILILLAGVAIMTTFSAFSPTSSDLPAGFQNYENYTSVTLLSTTGDQYSEENSRVIMEDQKTDIIQSFPIPDSTKKEKDIDADVDVDLDMDKDIDKEKELQKELERAQVNMDKASKAYNKAMVDYYKTMAKTKDLKDIEAWTIAEGEYAKALALAELYMDNIDFDIPEFQEQFSAEMFDEFEKWSVDENFDMSMDLYENALKLQEVEEALMEVEMIEQFELIEDQLSLQMEQIEDILADQIEELRDVHKLELNVYKLESKIKSELLKDNLINNEKDDLFFRLSAKKLEVNGNKQSPELHQKYLKLYEKLTGDKLEGTTQLIFQD